MARTLPSVSSAHVKSMKRKADDALFAQIKEYTESHICETLTIEQLCRGNSASDRPFPY